jgi:YidC/Oxa1 family membrane protein insertase
MNEKKTPGFSNEVRMLLAFGLMGIILVATPFVYRKLGIVTEDPAKAASATTKTRPEDKPSAIAPSAPQSNSAPGAASSGAATPTAAKPGAATPNAVVAASAEESWTLDTPVYHVEISNRGGTVRSWTLKKFKDSAGKPLELVNQPGAAKAGYPLSLYVRPGQPQPQVNPNSVLWAGHPSSDGLSISYEYSDGHLAAKKTVVFQRDSYLVQLQDELTLDGRGLPHLIEWRGGFGDLAVTNPSSHQAFLRYDTEKKKLLSEAAKAAKNGPVNNDGSFSFAGLEDQYFTAAFLPPVTGGTQTTLFSDSVTTAFNKTEEAFPGVAVGGNWQNQLSAFVGPKEVDLMRTVNQRLEDVVDWGIFGFIAKPLFLILQWANRAVVHNYGWAIILVTVFINIAMFPLKLTNLKSMRKMQQIQPELAKLNEKYKGVGMSDPRAAQKQQEMMDLYKRHGVNPMGGCVPLLIQLPFLWAFYKVLQVSIEMRHAEWLWVTDLSQPESLAIRLLPLIMIATSFLLQKMTPIAPGGDPSQQKIMQFMPLMYGFLFWSASSGLVLYWLTGNMVGIAQQWFFNKTIVPAAPAVQKIAAGKDTRKKA